MEEIVQNLKKDGSPFALDQLKVTLHSIFILFEGYLYPVTLSGILMPDALPKQRRSLHMAF